MDEFAYVFIAAVVVLAGLFILFAATPLEPLDGETIATFSFGEVGAVTDLPARTQTIGSFTIGDTQEQTIRSIPKLEVSTSYFGKDAEHLTITIDDTFLSSLKDVRITFDVAEANNYGPLIMKWNGLEVFNRKTTIRSQEIVIPPESVTAMNTLDIESAGPGFFFWASNVHVLEGIGIIADYGPEKLFPFEVLGSELQAFNRGEIALFSQAAAGERLVILVNGAEIFNEVPDGVETAAFDLLNAPVSAGGNVITFQAPDGPLRVEGASLNIFLSTSQIVRKGEFELTEDQMENLNRGLWQGKITFTIDEIRKGGGLTVKLNGNQLPVAAVVVGENGVAFAATDVVAGQNELTFSGTGTFVIPEVNVVLVR